MTKIVCNFPDCTFVACDEGPQKNCDDAYYTMAIHWDQHMIDNIEFEE